MPFIYHPELNPICYRIPPRLAALQSHSATDLIKILGDLLTEKRQKLDRPAAAMIGGIAEFDIYKELENSIKNYDFKNRMIWIKTLDLMYRLLSQPNTDNLARELLKALAPNLDVSSSTFPKDRINKVLLRYFLSPERFLQNILPQSFEEILSNARSDLIANLASAYTKDSPRRERCLARAHFLGLGVRDISIASQSIPKDDDEIDEQLQKFFNSAYSPTQLPYHIYLNFEAMYEELVKFHNYQEENPREKTESLYSLRQLRQQGKPTPNTYVDKRELKLMIDTRIVYSELIFGKGKLERSVMSLVEGQLSVKWEPKKYCPKIWQLLNRRAYLKIQAKKEKLVQAAFLASDKNIYKLSEVLIRKAAFFNPMEPMLWLSRQKELTPPEIFALIHVYLKKVNPSVIEGDDIASMLSLLVEYGEDLPQWSALFHDFPAIQGPAFSWAVTCGKRKLLGNLMAMGVSVNTVNVKGESAFTLATRFQQFSTLRDLLQAGAKPFRGQGNPDLGLLRLEDHLILDPDYSMETNLLFAQSRSAEFDYFKLIRSLLSSSGFALDMQKPAQPIKELQATKQADEIKKRLDVLIRDGGVAEKNLFDAVFWGDAEQFKRLLSNPSVNKYCLTENDETVLHWAIKRGYLPIVELILNKFSRDKITAPDKNGLTPLYLAVEYQQVEMVELLLKYYTTDEIMIPALSSGTNALHMAAYKGNEVIFMLIAKQLSSAQLNEKNHQGQTPLQTAAAKGHLKIVERLLDVLTPEQINARSADGHSALSEAVGAGNIEVVKLIMKKLLGETPYDPAQHSAYLMVGKSSVLHVAASRKQADMAAYLLKTYPSLEGIVYGQITALHLALINKDDKTATSIIANSSSKLCEKVDDMDQSPLFMAVLNDCESSFALLLEKVSLENKLLRDYRGYTALNVAVIKNKYDIVLALVIALKRAGIKSDRWLLSDKLGITPLHIAAEFGHAKVVGLFLPNIMPAQKIMQDLDGMTPLHFAATKGHHNVVESFIKALDASQCNIANNDGNTPLHLAVINGRPKIVRSLLSKLTATEANTRNKQGLTPLQLAMIFNQEETLKVLAGSELVNINALDEGISVMHFAVLCKDVALVEILLSHPLINLQLRDGGGFTPLERAFQQSPQHAKIISLLRERELADQAKALQSPLLPKVSLAEPLATSSTAQMHQVLDAKRAVFSFTSTWDKLRTQAEELRRISKIKSKDRAERYAALAFNEQAKPSGQSEVSDSTPSAAPASEDIYQRYGYYLVEPLDHKERKSIKKRMFVHITPTVKVDLEKEGQWKQVEEFLTRKEQSHFVGQGRGVQGIKKLKHSDFTALTIRRSDIGDVRLCTSKGDHCHETIAPWGNGDEHIDEIAFTDVRMHRTL